MTDHRIVSHEEWLKARTAFLKEEKEFSKARDRLSAQRRALPWERVDKDYRFHTENGTKSLSDLFDGRSQLIVYHFMYGPQMDLGCPHCSFWADNFNDAIVHMNHRDISMIAVSRGPLARLSAYKKRMGWTFNWVSSEGSDFNFDYRVSATPEETAAKKMEYNYAVGDMAHSEREGVSVFFKDKDGAIYHTYSTYARGIDLLNTAYNYIDLTPRGRDENGNPQYWVRRHDEYGNAGRS
jgi:predicted dithiol-disulfide oxidoreductase (DUF899 family)